MKLGELLKGYKYKFIKGDKNTEVLDIAYDSREVKKNSLFVAIKGEKSDGHNYISDAVDRGAGVVVLQNDINVQNTHDITVVKVNDTLDALAYLSSRYYINPTEDMEITAVTGTNGKTTITYLLESICTGENQIAGVIGTINYRYKQNKYPSSLTTPLSKELQMLFCEMRESEVQTVIVEASSHALDKKRLDYTDIDCAIFTNLTQDHLDYHEDFNSYFEAKKRLFSNVLAHSKKSNKIAISNLDDPFGQKIVEDYFGDKLFYSLENTEADVYAKNIDVSTEGITAEVITPTEKFKINSMLLGRHNLSNILASVACAWALGFSTSSIKKGIESLENVPGRLQKIHNNRDINIYIDYAHTPDALYNVLNMVKQLCRGRLIVVFGCGGDRDEKKRPLMGGYAAELADIVIITSDNPRTEDPDSIISDIEAGVLDAMRGGAQYIKITDRYEAILEAVQIAKEKDTILIAGKGHEDYQIIGNKTIHFDDREMCEKALEQAEKRVN